MISGRSLITACEEILANKILKINNSLQQRTVKSPMLFNIYTAELLKIFDLNLPNKPQAIASADDLVMYATDNWLSKI